jgi:hypothetical protein
LLSLDANLPEEGTLMVRMIVCDSFGEITAEIEASGPVMAGALCSERAEPVIRCAMLMAMSSLAEGGMWPTAALESMAVFMEDMRARLEQQHLV